jgi:glycogen debranching enzyme
MLMPFLNSDSLDLNRAFRIAVGDVLGNVVPNHVGLAEGQPALMAGLTYEAWTRDAAINTWNGLPAFWPAVARSTLLGELAPRNGQPEPRGQYWDAVVWVIGAWQYYLWTGDREFLATARSASVAWLTRMQREEQSADGLFRGPACYGDGVSAYGDRYAEVGGKSCILDWVAQHPKDRAAQGFGLPMRTLSTNCLYMRAFEIITAMDQALGLTADPSLAAQAQQLRQAIQQVFWCDALGRFRYYDDPWGTDDRQEGMGHAFALLFGLVNDPATMIARVYRSAAGLPCVWPGYPRYEGLVDGNRQRYGRHAGLVWPQVQAFWTEACARAGCWPETWAELDTLMAKALRDGNFAECYHPDDGLPEGGVQEIEPGQPEDWHRWCLRERHELLPGGPLLRWVSQPRTTWGATGMMRIMLHVCAGLTPMTDRMLVRPKLPPGVKQLSLTNVQWRQATLDFTILGTGTPSLHLDGNPVEDISAELAGRHQVVAHC